MIIRLLVIKADNGTTVIAGYEHGSRQVGKLAKPKSIIKKIVAQILDGRPCTPARVATSASSGASVSEAAPSRRDRRRRHFAAIGLILGRRTRSHRQRPLRGPTTLPWMRHLGKLAAPPTDCFRQGTSSSPSSIPSWTFPTTQPPNHTKGVRHTKLYLPQDTHTHA